MNYRNAKYYNDIGWVQCEIEHPQYGWIPYLLDPNDEDMTINNDDLLSDMLISDDVLPLDVEEFEARKCQIVRIQRNGILVGDVDPVVSNPLRWAALTPEQQAAWATYRQALLDVPSQAGFPNDITWPEVPSA